MEANMFTVAHILRHKHERQIESKLSRIRHDDPASLFGDGFSHYEDVNGRDQWSFEHEAGITFDISARIDPARFDLIVWLYDGGHVLADYSGFSVMAITCIIAKKIDAWLAMANEAKRPYLVDVNGSPCISTDYDAWKHEARDTARYQDRQYTEANEAREANKVQRMSSNASR